MKELMAPIAASGTRTRGKRPSPSTRTSASSYDRAPPANRSSRVVPNSNSASRLTRRALCAGLAATPLAAFGATPAPVRGEQARGWRSLTMGIRFMTTRDGRIFERGRETADWQFHGDGRVVAHIHSESDSPAVVRDCVYTLGPDWKPLECFLRLQVDGLYEGSGWFHFEPGVATFEGFNSRTGRISQRVALDGAAGALCAHPVTTDAMLVTAFDRSAGPGPQRLMRAFMSSPDPFGRTGPSLAVAATFMERVGIERLATAAGSYEAEHFLIYAGKDGRPAKEPVEEVWVVPGTPLFLRARAGGVFQTTYELTRWDAR